jgi:hypothetical protein
MSAIYKIATLIVSGISSTTRLRMLADFIYKEGIDIIILQEVIYTEFDWITGCKAYTDDGVNNRVQRYSSCLCLVTLSEVARVAFSSLRFWWGLCDWRIPRPGESYRVSVCVCVLLNMIKCNNHPLNQRWVGRRGRTEKEGKKNFNEHHPHIRLQSIISFLFVSQPVEFLK